MIGRLLRGGFMTAIYAYLYIPIIILIVNSFNSSRFGINWQGFTTDWYSLLMNNDSLLQAVVIHQQAVPVSGEARPVDPTTRAVK